MASIDDSFSSLGHLLNRNKVDSLLSRALFLAGLHKSLQSILPADLKPHCQLANIRDGVVIMIASSSIWASRLRFHQTELLNYLRNEYGLHIHTLKIKVSTVSSSTPKS